MFTKYSDLIHHLKKNMVPLYVIIGSDNYLVEQSIRQIKQNWSSQGDYDEKNFTIKQSDEWIDCFQEANHYNLFASHSLLRIRYDKKTIDSIGLTCMKSYIQDPNTRCVVLVEAQLVAAKQLQWMSKLPNALLIQATSLSVSAFQGWIKRELNDKGLHYEASIPFLIQQYNQNNMLAANQVIEALSLRVQPEEVITPSILFEHLTDQCAYPLFDLADACVGAETHKALHLLKYLNQHKTEPSLVLWLIMQEIRLLLQWDQLLKQAIPAETACKQLNIWPQRAKNYGMALKRLKTSQLNVLLIQCHQIDLQIKSAKTNEVWHALENLAIGFMQPN